MLQAETYYQYSQPTPVSSSENVDLTLLSGALDTIAAGTTGNSVSTYVRSQYAPAYGLDISKVYTNTTHPTLYTGDSITATIRIHNTTDQMMR